MKIFSMSKTQYYFYNYVSFSLRLCIAIFMHDILIIVTLTFNSLIEEDNL